MGNLKFFISIFFISIFVSGCALLEHMEEQEKQSMLRGELHLLTKEMKALKVEKKLLWSETNILDVEIGNLKAGVNHLQIEIKSLIAEAKSLEEEGKLSMIKLNQDVIADFKNFNKRLSEESRVLMKKLRKKISKINNLGIEINQNGAAQVRLLSSNNGISLEWVVGSIRLMKNRNRQIAELNYLKKEGNKLYEALSNSNEALIEELQSAISHAKQRNRMPASHQEIVL